ncbi:MAG: hypothetical protein ACD_20C00129G0007 [uncultured bacterium]|nr:MAG: hypothetical protein ACD_20C00129G0007 [uncultured bacterium]HBH18994.1 hypothetical protein [Cyanobacteria bacterium UBA9579]
MFKQVYRFLSVFLAANLLFSSAVLAKTQKDPNNQKRSIMQRLFNHKKPAEQKPSNQQQPNNAPNTNIQKPTYSDPGGYVTKYGVYFPDDIFDTYPSVKPE